MLYTVTYVDKNDGNRKWKRATDMVVAEDFGEQNSDNDYDICVSLYDYERLENQMRMLKRKLEQIKMIAAEEIEIKTETYYA